VVDATLAVSVTKVGIWWLAYRGHGRIYVALELKVEDRTCQAGPRLL
jgi:hypothetical protein